MKLFAVIIVSFGLLILYFQYNPSYKLSIESKYYYSIEDYKTAYKLADESIRLREYNTMALFVRNKSKSTLDLIDFNEESKDFQKKIIKILKKDDISKADKLRIKMMSDVIISKYKNLSLVLVDNESFKDLAFKNFTKFTKMNKKVIKALELDLKEE